MSEFETLKSELQEIKGLLKQALRKEEPKQEEWVFAEEACKMLNVRKSTLDSYRWKGIIEYRKPRPYQYSVASIEKLIGERTIRKVL